MTVKNSSHEVLNGLISLTETRSLDDCSEYNPQEHFKIEAGESVTKTVSALCRGTPESTFSLSRSFAIESTPIHLYSVNIPDLTTSLTKLNTITFDIPDKKYRYHDDVDNHTLIDDGSQNSESTKLYLFTSDDVARTRVRTSDTKVQIITREADNYRVLIPQSYFTQKPEEAVEIEDYGDSSAKYFAFALTEKTMSPTFGLTGPVFDLQVDIECSQEECHKTIPEPRDHRQSHKN